MKIYELGTILKKAAGDIKLKKSGVISVLLTIICAVGVIIFVHQRYVYLTQEDKADDLAEGDEASTMAVDSVSPTITLNGEDEVSLYLGDEYVEAGCAAQDDVDGDLSEYVTIAGSVDSASTGIYVITYTVQDSYGNIGEALRTVKVRNAPDSDIDYDVRGLPILMYHWFYDGSAGETGTNGNWMEIGEFEEQMKYLSENGYYFPTWDEVYDFIDGVITLYQINVTSFLITIENGAENINEYQSPLVSYRSHSHDMHRAGADGNGRFLTLTYEQAYEDLTISKEILGAGEVFCYPYGHYSDFTKKVLKDAGYMLAVTTEYGRVYPNMDKLSLHRVRMSADEGIASFQGKVQ